MKKELMKLKEGGKAPDFKANDQDGNLVSLSDFKGKKVALFFYPEDDTPTCTQQACNLRDHFSALKQKGIMVLGMSPDTSESHKKFEKKFDLPFTLLADPDKKIHKKYGVWAEKVLYGHHYIGVHRTTFLIDEKGKIEHIINRVLSKKHTEQILQLWNL